MVKVTITFNDNSVAEYRAEATSLDDGWYLVTIIDDQDKTETIQIPRESIKTVHEIQYSD